jgi:ketosteroid isomerase-like protein
MPEPSAMPDQNVELVRHAYEAYSGGQTAALLDLVDEDLEWTYLDPADADPSPQVCHGRGELEIALARQAKRGLQSTIEDVVGHGDKVMLVMRTPGIDAHRARAADDRTFFVLTLREGSILALRAYRNVDEARAVAGIE